MVCGCLRARYGGIEAFSVLLNLLFALVFGEIYFIECDHVPSLYCMLQLFIVFFNCNNEGQSAILEASLFEALSKRCTTNDMRRPPGLL